MYQFFAPPAPLQPFIQGYWRLHSYSHLVDKSVFVDGYADMIFNFGVAYERRNLNDPGIRESYRSSNLYAQRDHPVNIFQSGEVDLVGVRFCPGGLAAFMPMPAHELSNQTLDLYAAFGALACTLENQLFDAAHDTAQQIALLDAFFLQRLNLHSPLAFTRHIAQQIERRGGAIAMHALSDDVGYSIRTVDRLFRYYYGIPPKFYARLVRFQRALALLSNGAPATLTDVAVACGYYDLAHFTKECSAFTGLSAESYRDSMRANMQAPSLQLVQFLQDG